MYKLTKDLDTRMLIVSPPAWVQASHATIHYVCWGGPVAMRAILFHVTLKGEKKGRRFGNCVQPEL